MTVVATGIGLPQRPKRGLASSSFTPSRRTSYDGSSFDTSHELDTPSFLRD